MESIEPRPRRGLEVFSWTFYDFANTIFSMNVVSMYFSLWITVDQGREDILVSLANAISMALVALSMPVLGAISDQLKRRMPFLIGLTVICVLFTVLIGVVGQSHIGVEVKVFLAILLFIVANYSYQGGLVFYNALLPQVSTPQTMGKISGYGVALGYLGAIVGLVLVMPFNEGSIFGISVPFIPGGGRVATFVPTGLLFLVFSLPTFLFVRDRIGAGGSNRKRVHFGEALSRVRDVLAHLGRYPGVFRFLVAKFCYENAISAVIIFMAVYAKKVMGFTDAMVMYFLIVSTVSAVVGSLTFGRIVDRRGPKRTLVWVLAGWIFSLCVVLLTNQQWIFWWAGSLIGIFMGATWTTARPLLVTLVPKELLGEFFGLYSFSGKAAAIVGPLIWGLVVLCFGAHDVLKYKLAVLSELILIGIGLAILWRVPDKAAKIKERVGAGLFKGTDYMPFMLGVFVLGGLIGIPLIYGTSMGLNYFQSLPWALASCVAYLIAFRRNGTLSVERYILAIWVIACGALPLALSTGRPSFLVGGFLGFLFVIACGYLGIGISRIFKSW